MTEVVKIPLLSREGGLCDTREEAHARVEAYREEQGCPRTR